MIVAVLERRFLPPKFRPCGRVFWGPVHVPVSPYMAWADPPPPSTCVRNRKHVCEIANIKKKIKKKQNLAGLGNYGLGYYGLGYYGLVAMEKKFLKKFKKILKKT